MVLCRVLTVFFCAGAVACGETIDTETEFFLTAPGIYWASSSKIDSSGGTWKVTSWNAGDARGTLIDEHFINIRSSLGSIPTVTQPNGALYGPALDGPFLPFRDRRGNIWFSAANYTNYRILLFGFGSNPLSYLERSQTFDSNISSTGFDTSDWLMGFFSRGDRIDVVAHHERYEALYQNLPHLSAAPAFRQFDSIDALAGDGRRYFLMASGSGGTGSDIKVAAPGRAASSSTSSTPMVGLSHPSNLAYENGWYYVAVDYRDGARPSGLYDASGVIFLRSQLIPGTWQYFSSAQTWQAINGPISGTLPYVFFRQTNWNISQTAAASSLEGSSIRWHEASKHWVMAGYTQANTRNTGLTQNGGSHGTVGCINLHFSKTLANPMGFDEGTSTNNPTVVTIPNSCFGTYPYVSIVDSSSSDIRNFQTISSPLFHVYYVDRENRCGAPYSCIRRFVVGLTYTGNASGINPVQPPSLSFSSPLPIIGNFRLDDGTIYYSNGSQYCWQLSVPTGPIKQLSNRGEPTNLTYAGACGGATVGAGCFQVGGDTATIFYANGAPDSATTQSNSEFCYCGSARGSNYIRYPKIPLGLRLSGVCSGICQCD